MSREAILLVRGGLPSGWSPVAITSARLDLKTRKYLFMGEFIFDPEERTTPVIGLPTTDGETIKLHYFNTRVRMFGEDGFDHIEVTSAGETNYPSVKAVIASKAIIELLVENKYPASFDPYADPETKKVFARFIADSVESLDTELDELQDELDNPE